MPMLIPAEQVARIGRALPFWMSLILIPVAWLGAVQGGWTVILLPVMTWYFFSFTKKTPTPTSKKAS